MKKLAFYIDNQLIADVDASELELGNPGMGGTEYLILLISSMLAKRNNGIQVKLWMTRKQKLPDIINTAVVSNLKEAVSQAESEGYDTLILKHDADNIIKDTIKSTGNLKFYIWCHVFVCHWELEYYYKNLYVEKMVYVGREMCDLYRDHPLFEKSTYIYNCVNLAGCRQRVAEHPFSKRGHVVTYIGSLVPFKGFHKLAEAWPKVLNEVPDAQLYVIGSANLYDSSLVMGKYGIAERRYEEYFMNYLLEPAGTIHPSVHFMGRMGAEKSDILLETKVGVPNPTGITETFCLSAVEMQACGATVVTVKAPGYLDTVKNGKLCTNPDKLAKAIVLSLQAGESGFDEAICHFENHFSLDIVLKQWEDLLCNCPNRCAEQALVHSGYRLKWLKEGLRLVSHVLPLNHVLPPIERVLLFIERKLLRKITYMDSSISIGL